MKALIRVILLGLLLVGGSGIVARAASGNPLISGLIVFDSDTTFRYVYLYADGKKVLQTKYFREANSWVNHSQIEWFFSDGLIMGQMERVWKKSAWQNKESIQYSYNNNKLSLETYCRFDNNQPTVFRKTCYQYQNALLQSRIDSVLTVPGWKAAHRADFLYDINGRIDTTLLTQYQADTIVGQTLLINTYNGGGLLLLQDLQTRNRPADSWQNKLRSVWIYQPNTQRVAIQSQKEWNSELKKWENYQRVNYSYNDAGDIESEIYANWNMMFWQDDLRYDYHYDNNHVLMDKVLSKPIHHQWRNLISIRYSQVDQGIANRVESTYDFWGGNNGEAVTSYIPFLLNDEMTLQRGSIIQISSNDTLASMPELKHDVDALPVYPNPSDGIFYINAQQFNLLSWELTDLSGRLLQAQPFAYSAVVDLTTYPRGVYMLRVKTQQGIKACKLIKR